MAPPILMLHRRRLLALGLVGALPALGLWAQARKVEAPAAPSAPANPFQLSPEERARLDRLTREDHADMLRQLGITELRPGYDGWAKAGEPNAANYDPAKANPYPDWPEVLTLKDGRAVTTAQTWWEKRRPEIVEDFEREVYGRVPEDVPGVAWAVSETVETSVGGQPVVARRVVGHVDNSTHPAITVDISMAVVLPVHARGPVPVLVMFGQGNMPDEPVWRFPGIPEPAAPPSTEQFIAAGWGYVSLRPGSIQADNGAGLTAGIIGLTNGGKRRTPEQWGALRAWAWGAARALDYLETLPAVDAKRVGIEGVSRYGKAALVAMAFEPRFAVALVGSSGEGGAKPHRRHFGEAVENLTGSGAYHWMAGNFLKYGAARSSFGSRDAGDIPVDAHQLVALCAPRPTFISYGVPEKGDALWLDQHGSYMVTVAASPVFELLGARGLGVAEDHRTATMPPVGTGLLDGALAWRQHDGGHEDRSNVSFFLAWANRLLDHTPPPTPADEPRVRLDRNSHLAHQQLLEKAKSGRIDLYFLGDSITRRWGALDYPELLDHWKRTFHGWNAANFAWGGDRTENILWRLENGELDGPNPRVIVLQAGTNNIGREPGGDETVEDVTRGLTAIVDRCREKAPDATIVLVGIFPRNDNEAALLTIERINANLAEMADGEAIRFLDIGDRLADDDGRLHEEMTVDGLHLSLPGYEVWAEALKPLLTELLGPPAATDLAPPPTGDPSAAALPESSPRGAASGATLLAARAAAPSPKEQIGEDLSVERLADGVWLHVSHEELESFGRVPANGLVVASDGEAAFLDTPWTNAHTRALAGWVKEHLGARLTLVVPTHSHADCMGGLAAAHELGARSVAGARTVEFARRDGLTVPRESFERERDLSVGSRVLEVRHVGPGHTADTVVVWLPDARILFGGDLVRSAASRSLGYTDEADLDAWPDSVRALMEAYGDARLIVPGHGAPGGRELLQHTLELLAARPRHAP